MGRVMSVWAIGLLACSPGRALACATCFGDPDSPMAKGAVMGVIVMIGVISFVLTGIAGTSLFWIHRVRRMNRAADGIQHDTL